MHLGFVSKLMHLILCTLCFLQNHSISTLVLVLLAALLLSLSSICLYFPLVLTVLTFLRSVRIELTHRISFVSDKTQVKVLFLVHCKVFAIAPAVVRVYAYVLYIIL